MSLPLKGLPTDVWTKFDKR